MTDRLLREARRRSLQATYINHPKAAFRAMIRLADDVEALADALEASEKRVAERDAEIERLRGALESVSACAPEFIGGEPYLVGAGVFYAVRRALGQDHRGRTADEALARTAKLEEK